MTSTTTRPGGIDAELQAAQQVAIDQSGWGQPFRAFQPQNAAMWVGAFLLVAGVVSLFHFYTTQPHAYLPAVVGGAVVWALYCVPWVLFLRRKERYGRRPVELAVSGFAWGGLAATFALAINANDAALSLWGKLVSPNFAAEWGAALSAPFTEESSKAAGFVLLIALAPRLIRSAYDGFVVGAFIGLGFQVFEDWVYTVRAPSADLGTHQLQSVIKTFVTRGVTTGLVSHALFTALVCMGIVWLVGRPTEPRRPLVGLGFVLVAVVGHGAFDRAATVSDRELLAIAFVLPLVAIVLGGRWAARQERSWMHDLLAPEAAQGTLTDDELGALAGSARDRRTFVRTHKGRHKRAGARHLLSLGADLAEAIVVSQGRQTDAVESVRRELADARATAG
ncbi:MAG: PrsW family intramembrane metalloprotease [Acidimicrobiia bacterium]|nr:PrsW family intramembrane metalloprotease [Acidimicrobiia bacterium]